MYLQRTLISGALTKLTVKDAAAWASSYLKRDVSESNITYLLQYAKVNKYLVGGKVLVDRNELKDYYDKSILKKENLWKHKLGSDLDWSLSFDNLREFETTKHVHRLHPYKGKFIPQLVEYFLDSHINSHKKKAFFRQGDIVLDPFMGSGTTLVQARELGLHSIGVDVSKFNCVIAKSKVEDYDFNALKLDLDNAFLATQKFSKSSFSEEHNNMLKERLFEFNRKYFPNPEYKHALRSGAIKENDYARKKACFFVEENKELLDKLLESKVPIARKSFFSKWYSPRIKEELFYYTQFIRSVVDEKIKRIMQVIISRTARSCRATTHSDLATLKEPQYLPYYCEKHKKICFPINSILKHLQKNTYGTIDRLEKFARLKKNVFCAVIEGDSRTIDLGTELDKESKEFADLVRAKKISGIFTSPPYVGQIDYHEQHAYSYELFGIERKDELEIGPLFKGNSSKVREEYVDGVSQVLSNVSRFVKDDGNFFIVANDKYNLYSEIARRSGLKIVDRFKRPVLNRTEKDRAPYCETIFHMQKS